VNCGRDRGRHRGSKSTVKIWPDPGKTAPSWPRKGTFYTESRRRAAGLADLAARWDAALFALTISHSLQWGTNCSPTARRLRPIARRARRSRRYAVVGVSCSTSWPKRLTMDPGAAVEECPRNRGPGRIWARFFRASVKSRDGAAKRASALTAGRSARRRSGVG